MRLAVRGYGIPRCGEGFGLGNHRVGVEVNRGMQIVNVCIVVMHGFRLVLIRTNMPNSSMRRSRAVYYSVAVWVHRRTGVPFVRKSMPYFT